MLTDTVLSPALFGRVDWTGVDSTLFKGVDLTALPCSPSGSLLAWVDCEREPKLEETSSAEAETAERRGLLGHGSLRTLLGVRPMELLKLWFKEEFSLPERANNIYSQLRNEIKVIYMIKKTQIFTETVSNGSVSLQIP